MTMRVAMVVILSFVLAVGLLAWAGWWRGRTGQQIGAGRSGGDELGYLIDASDRFAPDRIQEHRALQVWIDGLAEADLAELRRVYERAAAGGHMDGAKRELRADAPDDVRRHRLFLLFLLFDHLGDRGVAPFDSFRVGNRAIPEEPVDWSELHEDLRWVIEPAEKYGSLRFESRILDYIDGMGESERAEVRRLRARFAVDAERMEAVGGDAPLKPRTPADFIYNLTTFFAYLHWQESGDLPGRRDWDRWAEDWRRLPKQRGAADDSERR